MKKWILLLFASLPVFNLLAQNVGIGNPTPAEKLDISGNINVTGTIKANGSDGLPNQVLMKNGAGTMVWGDLSDYKNFATFLTSGNWNVPAGTTKIAVELWGGGGGGAYVGGGGGGAYVMGVFTVAPSDVINFTIGTGGAGSVNASGSGIDGTSSHVTIGGNQVTAGYGQGAINNAGGGYFSSGAGGTYSATGGFTAFTGVNGERGTPSRKNYAQAGTSTFYEIGEMGNGGDAGNSVNTGAKGAYYISTPGLFPPISELRFNGNNTSRVPGGGGSSYLVNSSAGSNGMVTIRY